MADGFLKQVAVGAIGAVAAAALIGLWNWGSEGGLIRALGGVTEARATQIAEKAAGLKQTEIKTLIEERIQGLPSIARGAVVAFDRDDLDQEKCPPGWEPFQAGRARTIIGAGDPEGAPGKFGFDENGTPLTHYVHKQHGGEERHTLTVEEMPKHTHPLRIFLQSEAGSSRKDPRAWTDEVPNGDQVLENGVGPSGGRQDGKTQPHNNMPPYIALYFCKKEG